jgi:hypothetical protein
MKVTRSRRAQLASMRRVKQEKAARRRATASASTNEENALLNEDVIPEVRQELDLAEGEEVNAETLLRELANERVSLNKEKYSFFAAT